jgi:YHS domain-containing protein
MRGIILLIAVLVVYYALRTVVRSAVRSYHDDEQRRTRRSLGEDMVLDPECRTYVVRDRAVSRQIKGQRVYFCSEACAGRHQDRNRA